MEGSYLKGTRIGTGRLLDLNIGRRNRRSFDFATRDEAASSFALDDTLQIGITSAQNGNRIIST